MAGLLADRFKQRVIVVDTSCEIAGDGVLAHPCIGRARRLMVPARERQHEMLREAVQNHNPQVGPAGLIPGLAQLCILGPCTECGILGLLHLLGWRAWEAEAAAQS